MKKHKWVSGLAAYLLPRLGELLFISIFLAVVGLGPRILNVDGDLGRHITIGNFIINSRSIPTTDYFSFTKFQDPLTPHEWLSQVIFAFINRIAGLDGVVLLVGLLLGASIWVVYRNSVLLSQMKLLSLVVSFLVAVTSSLHWLARPHIYTILLAAIWTWELEKVRLGKRKTWSFFPLMMFLWVNLHGAFFAGLFIWACYFIGSIDFNPKHLKIDRSLLYAGLSSLLVSILNPDGLGIWKTGLGFLTNQYLVGHTAEYLPPDFLVPNYWPFLMMILISVLVLAISKKKISISHLLLLGSWTVMGLISARNIPLYAVIAGPILALYLSELIKVGGHGIYKRYIRFQERFTALEADLKGGFWAIITVVGVIGSLLIGIDLDFDQKGNVFLKETFPVDAVNWMEGNQLDGDGFNYFPWGGYLLYRNWPARRVFIDGQTDFYGEEITREYEKVITLSGDWQAVLDKYQVSWVIMPTDSELVMHLLTNNDWTEVYQDRTSTILTKSVLD